MNSPDTAYPIRGELTTYQTQFSKQEVPGISVVLDVHWRINNRQFFAATLDYPGVLKLSVPIPQLHSRARGLAPPHALFLACLHRAANRYGQHADDGHTSRDRLIWLYDIHLLLNGMTFEEIDLFVKLCRAFQVRTVCLDAIEQARTSLNTALPHSIVSGLANTEASELSAGYLTSSRLKVLYMDFKSLPRWRDKLQLLAEYSLPDSRYLVDRYAVSGCLRVPFAYGVYLLHTIKKVMQALWTR